jgi:hypothetical protein
LHDVGFGHWIPSDKQRVASIETTSIAAVIRDYLTGTRHAKGHGMALLMLIEMI